MKNDNEKPKIFLSYCHKDHTLLKEVYQYLKQVEHLCAIWYDEEVLMGNKLYQEIDENLEKSDIIFLLLSTYYLNSDSCKNELEKSIELSKSKGAKVIPIILSPCDWEKNEKIAEIMASNKNAEPWDRLSEDQKNKDGKLIIDELKKHLKNVNYLRDITLKKEFEEKLSSIGILEMIVGNKNLKLEDFFIDRRLRVYSVDEKTDTDSLEYEKASNLVNYKRISVSGEFQSGKSTIAYQMFMQLRDINMVPVYIDVVDENGLPGNINKIIQKNIQKIYDHPSGLGENKIMREKIVPIFDNFHNVKNTISSLRKINQYYERSILILDDTDGLQTPIEIRNSHNNFIISNLNPSERRGLIKKAVGVVESFQIDNEQLFTKEDYDHTLEDQYVDKIDDFLGKNLGNFIMPSSPLIILSVVLENSNKLDAKMTSLGYYYQAFIYASLRKVNVKDDDIDAYINFLNELAFHSYEKKQESHEWQANKPLMEKFIKDYQKKYNLSVKPQDLLDRLIRANIVKKDSLNQFSFAYEYIYYFFTASYISNKLDGDRIKEIIKHLSTNMGIKEHAYLIIFISHHHRNYDLIDMITNVLDNCFKHQKIASLETIDLRGIDEKIDALISDPKVKAKGKTEVELARKKRDESQDKEEENGNDNMDVEDDDFQMIKELKISIRAAEVVGQIIKNRHGSIEIDKIDEIFEKGLDNHLRMLSPILEDLTDFKEYFDSKLDLDKEMNKNKDKRITNEEIKMKMHQLILNEYMLFSMAIIFIVTKALSSKNLMESVRRVSLRKNSTFSYLVYFHAHLYHTKSLPNIIELKKRLKDPKFSELAKKIIRYIFNYHVEYHNLTTRDVTKYSALLGIQPDRVFNRMSINREK